MSLRIGGVLIGRVEGVRIKGVRFERVDIEIIALVLRLEAGRIGRLVMGGRRLGQGPVVHVDGFVSADIDFGGVQIEGVGFIVESRARRGRRVVGAIGGLRRGGLARQLDVFGIVHGEQGLAQIGAQGFDLGAVEPARGDRPGQRTDGGEAGAARSGGLQEHGGELIDAFCERRLVGAGRRRRTQLQDERFFPAQRFGGFDRDQIHRDLFRRPPEPPLKTSFRCRPHRLEERLTTGQSR